jgi:hypothetical protein
MLNCDAKVQQFLIKQIFFGLFYHKISKKVSNTL